MHGLEIAVADPASADFATAWDIVEHAQRADRPHALMETLEAIRRSASRPSSTYDTRLVLVRRAGNAVAAALVGRHLGENAHLGDLEVDVLPAHRGRGIGSALLRHELDGLVATGHTSVLSEVSVPTGQATSAGLEFARARGFTTVHEEDHLVLDLPADPPRPAVADGFEVLSWTGPVPEEHLEAYCAMRTQMNADVPLGEVDMAPTVHTPAKQRESEERMAPSYLTLTAVARRLADDRLVGYTLVFLPHGVPHVWQDDTLVMPDARGHRLGLALKHATLDLVREHPERTTLHTWTDPENEPMRATNRAFGFRAVDRMHEVQWRAPA